MKTRRQLFPLLLAAVAAATVAVAAGKGLPDLQTDHELIGWAGEQDRDGGRRRGMKVCA